MKQPRAGTSDEAATRIAVNADNGHGKSIDILAHERPGLLARIAMVSAQHAAPISGRLAALVQEEREQGSGFNFVPVFFGLGILVYFSAPSEPFLPAVALSAVIACALAARQQVHGKMRLALVILALMVCGMLAGQVRTQFGGTPVVSRDLSGKVSGLVLGAETTRKGGIRYLLRPISIEGLSSFELPGRLRLTAASKHTRAAPGSVIEGVARLQPFSGPAIPDGHDFGFYNWLDGFGATGFFIGAPAANAGLSQQPRWNEWPLIVTNNMRSAMTKRIRDGIGGEAGDISAALITGERLAVDADTEESFRRSGLTHILSISGLHMVLVTMTVVACLRFILAFFPAIALNRPIRKWAVSAGFVSATFYLFLSGAEVPTQRSYLMIAVMLMAMLVDRRAITLRNVALAALAILIVTPEAVMEPGFQMSFAAAAALVAGHSAWTGLVRNRMAKAEEKPARAGLARTIALHVAALAATSLVAGIATGVFAAWHFHRVAPMGLFANLIAMPVVSFFVMPLALASVLLMPYGLEALALKPMGWAVDLVVAISDFINRYPAADGVGLQPNVLLVAGAVGIVLLVALKTRLRLAGLALLLAIPLLPKADPPPDIIIAQNGRSIAMRDASGSIGLLYPGRDKFISDIWMRAWPPNKAAGGKPKIISCDKDHCIAMAAKGVRVEIVYNPDLLAAACNTADILIAPRLRWVNCGARKPELVLVRDAFETGGTHVIRISGSKPNRQLHVQTAIAQDLRPWNVARRPKPLPDLPRANPGPPVNSGGSSLPDDPEPSPGPG